MVVRWWAPNSGGLGRSSAEWLRAIYMGAGTGDCPAQPGTLLATERRRNRTFQAGGCPALPVLKRVPLRPGWPILQGFRVGWIGLHRVRSADLGKWLGTWFSAPSLVARRSRFSSRARVRTSAARARVHARAEARRADRVVCDVA